MPTVTVIVPVYGVERYLRRCVDSILSQSFRDLELILVDDGSPDACGNLCDGYQKKDCRIRVIHQENAGVSAARNAGLEVARGTYITFCDGDDYWLPGHLEEMVAAARESGADLLSTNYTAVDEQGNVLRYSRHHCAEETIGDDAQRCSYLIHSLLRGKTGWEIGTRLFRAEVIQAQKLRFCTTCGNYAEDVGFLLEYCLYVRKTVSISGCGYCYRLRPDSMVGRSLQIPKVQEKNEVSAFFGRAYFRRIRERELQRLYPVIHGLLLWGEYEKLLWHGNWAKLPEAVNRVRDREWYEEQTRGILSCKAYLTAHFGWEEAARMCILSRFCLHQSPILFRLESGICNRIIMPLRRRWIHGNR